MTTVMRIKIRIFKSVFAVGKVSAVFENSSEVIILNTDITGRWGGWYFQKVIVETGEVLLWGPVLGPGNVCRKGLT